ncbi:MAG TPA: hypothetical protein PLC65_17120 [Bacteroidia bacterium]|nr:hypothetical protein [Bacteroidia bacterium]
MAVRNYKELRYTSYWQEEEEAIIFIKYAPKLAITLPIAKELVKTRLEYTHHKKHYTVIDFTNVLRVEKEARDYMNEEEHGLKNILAGAFLSNSIVGIFFINLYLKINKPKVPAKFFTSKAEAVKWLQQIKSIHKQL